MARETVVKIFCDRCKRMELIPVEHARKSEEPEFYAKFPDGDEIKYGDLCASCKKTIVNLKTELTEWDREIKRAVIEFGPKIMGEQAAPLQTAPDYSPPKPHSGESTKR